LRIDPTVDKHGGDDKSAETISLLLEGSGEPIEERPGLAIPASGLKQPHTDQTGGSEERTFRENASGQLERLAAKNGKSVRLV
jgi:hypothetical protein